MRKCLRSLLLSSLLFCVPDSSLPELGFHHYSLHLILLGMFGRPLKRGWGITIGDIGLGFGFLCMIVGCGVSERSNFECSLIVGFVYFVLIFGPCLMLLHIYPFSGCFF